jgi:DNA-directed RNA polymerase specialized sigma24 family protein
MFRCYAKSAGGTVVSGSINTASKQQEVYEVPKVQISVTVPDFEYTRKFNIEDKLKQWHRLETRRQQLERIIPQQEERLAQLKDKLSRDGIMSSLTNVVQEYVQRGSVSDKFGDLVADTLDKVTEFELRIQKWRMELALIYADIADIEYYVYQLKPTYQKAVTMVYRDGISQYKVAEELYMSRSMVDKMIRKSIKSMKGW